MSPSTSIRLGRRPGLFRALGSFGRGTGFILVLALQLLDPRLAAADEEKSSGAGDLLDLYFPSTTAEIGVASRREQSVAEAPATVTVFTRDDIRQLGLRTLTDVLRLVPGFTVMSDFDDLVMGSRGIVSDNNTRFVLLMNGHNLSSTQNLGINPNHLFPMTLENVRQIEVLKGPGSVLWGSGALLGVINIVTEDGTTFEGTQVGGGGGNRDTVRAFAQHGQLFGEDGDLFLSGKFYQSNGTEWDKWHFVGPATDSDGDGVADVPWNPGSDLSEMGPSFEAYAHLRTGKLEFSLRGFDQRDHDTGSTPTDTETQSSDYIEAAYEARPVRDMRVRTALFGDFWSQDRMARMAGNHINFNEWRYGGTVLADYPFLPAHRITAGIDLKQSFYLDYSRVKTISGRRMEEASPFGADVFGQYEWAPFTWLGLTGALRFTSSTLFDESLDPKGAIRVTPLDGLTFKYIAQTAFLHPSAFQRNAFVFPTADVPDPSGLEAMQRRIKDERMFSQELQFIWDPASFGWTSVTVFWNQLEDLINRNSNSQTPSYRTFVNFGDVESYGLEWEGHWHAWRLRQDASVSFSRAFLETREFGLLTTAAPNGRILGYPAVLGNVVTRYLASKDLSFASIVRVLGMANYYPTKQDRVNGTTHSTDISAQLDLNVLCDDVGIEGLGLGFTVLNVLDDRTRLPLAADEGSAPPEALTVYGEASYRW